MPAAELFDRDATQLARRAGGCCPLLLPARPARRAARRESAAAEPRTPGIATVSPTANDVNWPVHGLITPRENINALRCRFVWQLTRSRACPSPAKRALPRELAGDCNRRARPGFSAGRSRGEPNLQATQAGDNFSRWG